MCHSLHCKSSKCDLVFPSINLKKGNVIFSVDLVARGMVEGTLGLVSLQTLDTLQILETELTDVDHRLRGQLLGVGGEVPRAYPIATQLNLVNVLHPSDGVFMLRVVTHAS